MTREAGTFAVTILFGSLAVVIALLPMTGVAFGQENNFVLSSPAFADNGPMAQKYAGKNMLIRIASVKIFHRLWNGAMLPRLRGATRSSCTTRRGETVWASCIGSCMASMPLRLRYLKAPAMAKGRPHRRQQFSWQRIVLRRLPPKGDRPAPLCVHDHRDGSGSNRTEARLNDAANARCDWLPRPRRSRTCGSLRSVSDAQCRFWHLADIGLCAAHICF